MFSTSQRSVTRRLQRKTVLPYLKITTAYNRLPDKRLSNSNMDRLPAHTILKFHPDTLQHVREEHGLDKPGQMDAAINLLDDWVKKQTHFTKKEFPREYLERTIILDKGSVEQAKLQLDKLFTIQTLMPYFFERIDTKNDYHNLHEHFVDALLPKLTKDHYRIYASKVINDNGVTNRTITLYYAFATLLLEHVRSNDYCSGYVAIIDYRNVNILEVVAHVNLIEARQFVSLITEGYQMRVKGIHVLTTSKAVDILVRIMKKIFSKKIGDRIRVHTDMESLYECLPKDVLPKELGGELKSIVDYNGDWCDLLGTKENIEYFKDMNKAGVNENLKNGATKWNSDIMGISGSFRTLNVD